MPASEWLSHLIHTSLDRMNFRRSFVANKSLKATMSPLELISNNATRFEIHQVNFESNLLGSLHEKLYSVAIGAWTEYATYYPRVCV